MVKKTKISNHQLFALALNCAIGTTVISVSSSVATLAKQDAWIAAIIAPIIGLPFIWLYYYLGKLYPGKTLIDMLNYAFGKWLGWVISAFFVIFVCFLDAAQLMSYIGNFMQSEYMTETPIYAINVLLAVALAIGLIYGLEAIARSSEVFFIVVIVLIMLAMLLNLENVHIDNLLPVLEKGIVPPLKGSLHLSSYLTWPFIILLMIYPSSTEETIKTRNSLLIGYILGATISFICTIMSILVLGSAVSARSQYPIYLLAKEVDIGIIDRIEGVISCAWILTAFIKTLLYFYAGTIGLCQLFKIEDYKRVVLPLTLIILVYSGIVYPDAAYQTKWDSTTWIPFIATFGGVLPIIILIITKIKNKKLSSN